MKPSFMVAEGIIEMLHVNGINSIFGVVGEDTVSLPFLRQS